MDFQAHTRTNVWFRFRVWKGSNIVRSETVEDGNPREGKSVVVKGGSRRIARHAKARHPLCSRTSIQGTKYCARFKAFVWLLLQVALCCRIVATSLIRLSK